MADFTVYTYQCCPIRNTVTINEDGKLIQIVDPNVLFPEEDKKEDDRSLENMERHQEIIDKILTDDRDKLFMSSKKGQKGAVEPCLAFCYQNKTYPFKVLIPAPEKVNENVYLLRVAKLTKKNREHNFMRDSWIDEPSALVIIDNRRDMQRIMVEHTSAWSDTDTVRNIIQTAFCKVLKHYRLIIRIEPVWKKEEFWNLATLYAGRIRTIEFDLGWPNMARVGDKFLSPLKASLKNIQAAGTVKLTLPKEVVKAKKDELKNAHKQYQGDALEKPEPVVASILLDKNNPDEIVDEFAYHCAEYGRNTKFTLDNGQVVTLGKLPDRVVKTMTSEQRKAYEENEKQRYSNLTVKMSEKVSNFDGQDDLFDGTMEMVKKQLNDLNRMNLGKA